MTPSSFTHLSYSTATIRTPQNKHYYAPIPVSDPTTPPTRYTTFPHPILPTAAGPGTGFDAHIYWMQSSATQTLIAKTLHTRIRETFPELTTFVPCEGPAGPMPVASFEVNLFTPAEFGAFVPWLMVNRQGLSVLVHANTNEGVVGDHTTRAMWMGERWPLDLERLGGGKAG